MTTTNALTAEVPTQTTTAPVTSLPNVSHLDMKDQREYERARQRALKPSDRVLKGLFRPPKRPDGNIGRGPKRHLQASHSRIRYAPNPRWDAWVAKSDLILDEDDVVDDLQHAEDCAIAPRDRMHVSLSDLIKPERKRDGIAQGYELVPRLRPVMIIEEVPSDDNVSSEEEEFDWELIPVPRTTPTRLTKKAPAPLTYASVVSSSATNVSSK